MEGPQRNTMVILLAYMHRYVYPVLIIILPLLFGGDALLLFMGIGFLMLAAYDLIGYKCRWKHIFCSLQNAYHKKMTPASVNWSKVRRSDAYGIPAIFGVFGAAMILCYFFC